MAALARVTMRDASPKSRSQRVTVTEYHGKSAVAVRAHDCDCWLTITAREQSNSLCMITVVGGVRPLLSRSVLVLHPTR